MAWPIIVAESEFQFVEMCSSVCATGAAATAGYIFRGQAKTEWGLVSSLGRILGAAGVVSGAEGIESDCLAMFKRQSHLHVPVREMPAPDDDWAWYALMQHHRAPTRLLDWTTSPFVAAYFACVEEWEGDGVVWLVHARTLRVESEKEAVKKVGTYWPNRPSERMVAQQGFFVYPGVVGDDLEPVIDEFLRPVHGAVDGEVYGKLVIPTAVKPALLKQLRLMNISAASLFPGVDGLGATARELAMLSGVYPRVFPK